MLSIVFGVGFVAGLVDGRDNEVIAGIRLIAWIIGKQTLGRLKIPLVRWFISHSVDDDCVIGFSISYRGARSNPAVITDRRPRFRDEGGGFADTACPVGFPGWWDSSFIYLDGDTPEVFATRSAYFVIRTGTGALGEIDKIGCA